MMKDIKIEATHNRTYVVKATTERFGENEIMFESWNYKECLEYLSRFGIRYAGKKPAFPRHRANRTTVTRHADRWNPRKVWIVKHYADGHYGINQEIAGKIFYSSYQRTNRTKIQELLAACC